MDPTQTMIDILSGFLNGDMSGTTEDCENLYDWIRKDGFLPDPVAVEDWLNNWNAEREAPGASDRLRAGL